MTRAVIALIGFVAFLRVSDHKKVRHIAVPCCHAVLCTYLFIYAAVVVVLTTKLTHYNNKERWKFNTKAKLQQVVSNVVRGKFS